MDKSRPNAHASGRFYVFNIVLHFLGSK